MYNSPRVNPNAYYELWVIMTCLCWFISCYKSTTLLVNIDIGVNCACVGAGNIWKLSIFSTWFFFCEPKTALKKGLFKNNKTIFKCHIKNFHVPLIDRHAHKHIYALTFPEEISQLKK